MCGVCAAIGGMTGIIVGVLLMLGGYYGGSMD